MSGEYTSEKSGGQRLRTLVVRSAVLLLLAALVSAQYAAASHELTARHAICPQHGEVVDLDGPGPDLTSSIGGGAQGTQLSGIGDEPLRAHHRHCLFVSSHGKRNIFRASKPQGIQLPKVALHGISSVVDTPRLSGAIYLAAPKHSPPLV
jgi:hypothetical protein